MNRMRCRSSDGATWTVSARGNRAITHRLWVKTAQVTVRCRLANPLARRGRPKKRFLKIPIRPSVCARRVWAAANCSSWSRCCRLSGERGADPVVDAPCFQEAAVGRTVKTPVRPMATKWPNYYTLCRKAACCFPGWPKCMRNTGPGSFDAGARVWASTE